MGGRGKGGTASTGFGGEYVASAQISYNPDRGSRPYSIAGAWDQSNKAGVHGQASWGTDSRGRPRTFASERAAADFVRSNASGPVQIERFSKEGQHYPQAPNGRTILPRGAE